MKIKTIVNQNRRDFRAIYECEHCGFEKEGSGYDDANFHQNVIPKMTCPKCGKVADESYEAMGTKYPEGYQVQENNHDHNSSNSSVINSHEVNGTIENKQGSGGQRDERLRV